MDLEPIVGAAWAGWSLRDGQLYAPEWRGGISPGEIRALPYLYAAQAEHKKRDREILELKKQLAAVSRLCGWYHRQLSRESRLGLALSRIID